MITKVSALDIRNMAIPLGSAGNGIVWGEPDPPRPAREKGRGCRGKQQRALGLDVANP